MKDAIARESIDDLSRQVRDLKQQLQYYEETTDFFGISRPELLTATDVIRRFNEIYQHLSVERNVTPQVIKLERKIK